MLQYQVKSPDVCGRLAGAPSAAVFPAFTRALPFGVKQRNLLFLFLFLATVAWFLRPLGELFFPHATAGTLLSHAAGPLG